MKVSRTGYHRWLNRQPCRREREEAEILKKVKHYYKESDKTYGSPRIHQDLKANGIQCSLNRTARIVRKHSIRVVYKERFIATTDSKHGLPVAENLLEQK